MSEYTQYDIRNASFDEFVDFLFDHEVVSIPRSAETGPGPWYWAVEVLFDPNRVAQHYIRLFTAPEFLLERFTREQLEQGFWAIQSSNIDCSVYEIIWNTDVPLEIRESCVRTMSDLFALLFSKDALETSVEMWWDSMAYDWYCGNRARKKGGEDESMQDTMFFTLEKILGLDSMACQDAALHGLGHLCHPQTKKLIDVFLEKNPSISNERREYALAAARFEVM